MNAVAMFRCDASADLGGGHVMRCLAFAETLVWAGWSCVFVTRPESIETVPALAKSQHVVRNTGDGDLPRAGEGLVVVDHYGLDERYERTLRSGGRTIVTFDDLADRAHDCDVLLDPAPREEDAYTGLVPANARLLLGADKAIVFRHWRDQRIITTRRLRAGGPVRRILISMGMTDPLNVTAQVVESLKAANIDAAIDVVLGFAAPHATRVREVLSARMTLHIDPPNLAELAARADLAIGALGTSSFERALLGLPAILVTVADNQRFMAQTFAESGAAQVQSHALLSDPNSFANCVTALVQDAARRASMSRCAASMNDGRGAQRLLVACAGRKQAKDGSWIALRVLERADESWLLDLQRQPSTRKFATNPATPTSEEHTAWLESTLDDPDRLLAVVEADGDPVGVLRLDRADSAHAAFEISIALNENCHGRGIGGSALSLVRILAPAADLLATVLPENRASRALFKSAGFEAVDVNRFCSRAA
jgi:UDP-2,4-diacetamido-2,4,6-trideoxy-beta-L-altropyranose hydrolase